MPKRRILALAALIAGCRAPFVGGSYGDSSSAPADPAASHSPGGADGLDDAPLNPDAGRSTSDAAVPVGPSVQPDAAAVDGGAPDADAPPALRDVYRAFNAAFGDHLQGVVANEGAPDWTSEGVGFRVYADGAAGRAALYRCRVSDGHHFLSTQADCEGQVVEGPLGYLGTTEGDGLPLYRCVFAADHLSTLDPTECQTAGFLVEGPQGFAFR